MLKNRQILAKITNFLDKEINLLFLGSRQVGKTRLLLLIEQQLLQRNIAKPNQIFKFDMENSNDLAMISNLDPLQFIDSLYTRSTLPPDSPIFLFLDEIQYIPKASSFLKVIADHRPHARMYLSGSSSLEIKRIFSDRLTGRKISFQVNTLNFSEYLSFQENPLANAWEKIDREQLLSGNIQSLKNYTAFLPEINPLFEEFVLSGGYPKPSLKEYQSVRYDLLSEIRDQYARRDVRDILNIDNIPGFNLLLGLLASQIGNLVNMNELATSARLSRHTVDKYLFLMSETFIINLVVPYFKNSRLELVKMPKIYFSDTGLRNALIGFNFNGHLELRPDKGALVENTIYHELRIAGYEPKFWRTKSQTEVDFVLSHPQFSEIPIEVKYQPMNNPSVPNGIESFISKYNPHHAIVATRDYLGKTTCNSTPVYFIPVMFF
ncbi:MAG: ATP-binding protein [Candidatus Magasanikbacteria bacterium]|nr:ATP-binding protein [Candidatus Magasanikbacteria bacterium]